jgi:Phosphotransferase enzyme family
VTSAGPDPVALWTSSAFVDEVRAWVAAQLAPHGIRLSGEWLQSRVQPWSSTIRFETTEGRIWFKVNGRGTAYEASLVALLGKLCPGLAPRVIAQDKARAWSLTRDAGPVLRSKAAPDALWEHWENLLPRYAEAQIELADERPQLLATGAPDRRPARLPLEYRRLLGKLASQPVHSGGLTAEQASDLERAIPTYEDYCAELTASPVPESIQHDDLHSNNVCWPGDADDVSSVRIVDWGDAAVAHPFGTMLATLNSIAFHAGVLRIGNAIEEPRLLRIRDAYLEPFSRLGRRSELQRWVMLARSTACLTRALSWERALQDAPATVAAEQDFPVRAWLLEVLEPWAHVD